MNGSNYVRECEWYKDGMAYRSIFITSPILLFMLGSSSKRYFLPLDHSYNILRFTDPLIHFFSIFENKYISVMSLIIFPPTPGYSI